MLQLIFETLGQAGMEILFQILIDLLIELLGYSWDRKPLPERARLRWRLRLGDIALWMTFAIGSALILLPAVRAAAESTSTHGPLGLVLAMVFSGSLGWLAAIVRHRYSVRLMRNRKH